MLPLSERLLRALPLAILVTSSAFVAVTVVEPDGLPRLRALRKELTDVREENAAASRQVEQLRAEVKSLREDPTAIEHIAREQLGLVRRNEVVFQLKR